MEDLRGHDMHLNKLQHQARTLTSVGLSLVSLFAQEASWLSREDEASRLRVLHYVILEQLDGAKRSEDAASDGHSKASLVFSLGGLAAGLLIKKVSKNERLSALSGHLLNSLVDEQSPFGTVLVCIGPKGLPDDAAVVSISRLARESDRQESEVTNELKEWGFLLLSKEEFSLIIDKLVVDVREGRLRLPISRDKLPEVKTSGQLKLEVKKSE